MTAATTGPVRDESADWLRTGECVRCGSCCHPRYVLSKDEGEVDPESGMDPILALLRTGQYTYEGRMVTKHGLRVVLSEGVCSELVPSLKAPGEYHCRIYDGRFVSCRGWPKVPDAHYQVCKALGCGYSFHRKAKAGRRACPECAGGLVVVGDHDYELCQNCGYKETI